MTVETPAATTEDTTQQTLAGDTEGQTQPTEQTAKAPDPSDESAAEGLLETEDDRKSWNDLPAPVRKLANKFWTQKTQGFSAKRKEVETLLPFKPLIDALQDEEHPERARMVAKILAQQTGLKIAEDPQQVQKQAEDDPHFATLAQQFGPEAAKAMTAYMEQRAAQIADAKLAPVQKTLTAEAQRTAAQQAQAVIERFTKSHPDWKQHEDKMTETGKRLKYIGGDEYEYLEMLHTIATKDERSADATKKVLEKLNKSAAAADSPDNGVQANRVATTLPAYKSHDEGIRNAYEMAKRGQVVER